jgi:glucose/arabinose dehydrogenase
MMSLKAFHLLIAIFFILLIISLTQANNVKKQLEKEDAEPQIIETRLDTVWEIQVSERGDIYYTERPGRLNVIVQEDGFRTFSLKDVSETSEGGLLGFALHPKYGENHLIYVYKTVNGTGGLKNILVRYELIDWTLKNEKVLIDSIPAGEIHNGGRIRFGPDGYLYITTGDANRPDSAQQISSLGGKILRVTDEGQPAPGNPFNNAVYAYGLRNSQGLAWDNEKRLWATDHGSQANDELNLIMPGKNYGWPVIRGQEKQDGMENPKFLTGVDTFAPAGMAFHEGRLYFGGLRGKTLYTLKVDGENLTDLHELYKNQFGRIRAVYFNHTQLYIGTSNRDGRGEPVHSDDRLMIVPPYKEN